MRTRLLIISLFMLLSAGSLSAVTVTVDFGADNAALAPVIADIVTQVDNTVGKYGNMPDFGRGFGNASTYSSHAATLRGYQGYSIFAISIGSMVSLQAPNEDPMFFTKLQGDLDDGDLYTGIGANPLVVQAGINLSFIIDGLYLSLKAGKFNYQFDMSSYKIGYHSNIYGGFLNYDLLREKSILSGILLWRGVSVGSGLIFSDSHVDYKKKLKALTASAGITSPGVFTITADVDPSVEFELSTTSYIIPVELYTSIRIFYIFNIGVGGGIDFVAGGNTDIKLLSDGGVTITDDGTGGANTSTMVGKTGTITVDASTNNVKADRYRAKLMTNLGLSLGPVFIDFPLTYYFTDNGYAVGLSAGMVW